MTPKAVTSRSTTMLLRVTAQMSVALRTKTPRWGWFYDVLAAVFILLCSPMGQVPLISLTAAELEALTARTLAHYDASAEAFEEGTRAHDVSQNYAAFLGAIEGRPPFTLLDFGCGPGRDLAYFRSLGHEAVGLDGAAHFVAMARAATGCEVIHQDFLHLSLPKARFDGVFANASLFHVPTQELGRVLSGLWDSLVPRGVLFCSNPHGGDTEGFSGERYGAFLTHDTWRGHVTFAGFSEIAHYYRPAGKPRNQQPWLATVWRKESSRAVPIRNERKP